MGPAGAAGATLPAGAGRATGRRRPRPRCVGSRRRPRPCAGSLKPSSAGWPKPSRKTGKTTVATSLALALAELTAVQFVDADVEAPNAHLLLRPDCDLEEEVTVPVPRVDEARCTLCGGCAGICWFGAIAVARKVVVFPELCHGCGGCARVCPEKAIAEENRPGGVVRQGWAGRLAFAGGRLHPGEPFAVPVIRALKRGLDGGRVVIVDASPGTSCPVVEAVRGSDLCLLVTEPTPFGLNDLRLAVELTERLGVPTAVLINRQGIGDDEVEDWCRDRGLPLLDRIPFDRGLARAYARGMPAVRLPGWKEKFRSLGRAVLRRAGGEGPCGNWRL